MATNLVGRTSSQDRWEKRRVPPHLRALLGGIVAMLTYALGAGCGARTSLPIPEDTEKGGGGAGGGLAGGGAGGIGGEGGAGVEPVPCDPVPLPSLTGTLRDLTMSHPDFEGPFIGDDRGIVLEELGADDAPLYAGQADNPSTNGPTAFFAWYHDVPGVNLNQTFELGLTQVLPDVVGVVDDEFFPVDNQLFGNEGLDHNFHFTLAVKSPFRYRGGEVLEFAGDDDLFVFINRKLVLDLGGVHSIESGTVSLDAIAEAADLELDSDYDLHLFFAERHTSGSNFRLMLWGFQTCIRQP